MNIMTIVLFMLSGVFGHLKVCVAYSVVTYLNKKALGMQTLVDQMIKDAIYVIVFSEFLLYIVRLIDHFSRPVSQSLAVLVASVIQFARLTGLWQLNMIFLMRYLYAFHYANLNIVDEKLMKRITRCSVGILSTITILFIMSDVENSHAYQHFADGDLILVMNPMIMTVIISIVIIIITQFKIEMFKKSVDAKQFDQMESGEDDQGHKCKTGEHNP